MSIDYSNPHGYIGDYERCYAAYSNNEGIREGAASGGVVSALLIHLLEQKYIDGVFISRQFVRSGKIEVESFIATTVDDILDSRTSIYTHFQLEKSFNKIEEFDGKVAIVLLPCHIKYLEVLSRKRPLLDDKIKYKIALFCGGVADQQLMYKILDKNRIDVDDVERIYSRKGHWRGNTYIRMKDSSERQISYSKNWSAYKNAFFYATRKCFSCSDHFGYDADFCCGDIWLREMKKKDIKNTAVVTKNKEAYKIFSEMIDKQMVTASEVGIEYILRGNKRAIIYKYHTAEARKKIGKMFGYHYTGQIMHKSKWNHYLASVLILLNMKVSQKEKIMNFIFRIPKKLIYLYMVLIRVFISF